MSESEMMAQSFPFWALVWLWVVCGFAVMCGVIALSRFLYEWLTDGIDVERKCLKSELKELEPTDEKPKVRWMLR